MRLVALSGAAFGDRFDEFTRGLVAVHPGGDVRLGNDAAQTPLAVYDRILRTWRSAIPDRMGHILVLPDTPDFRSCLPHDRAVNRLTFGKHPQHDIAIRQDTDQPRRGPRLDHRDRTNVFAFHDFGSTPNRVARFTRRRVGRHYILHLGISLSS